MSLKLWHKNFGRRFMELKVLFKLAPAAAIKYFKGKNNKLSWDWYDLWQNAHRKSFTVAKAMREDILKDIRSSLDKALEEGKTFQDFQKELKPTLQKKGWWNDVMIGDSEGNIEKVQLGSMYRLKTIYSVNMQTAYQTGRYKTQIENTDNRPYWQYVAVLDQRTRAEHAQLHDLVFPHDDTFWSSFYPPNGWRYNYKINTLSPQNDKKRNLYIKSSSVRLSQEDKKKKKKSGQYQ